VLADVLPVLVPVVSSALLVGALAVPMARRQVRPNGLYGLRTPATRADPEVWYEANARSGRDLLVWSGVTAALALGTVPLAPRLGVEGYGLLCVAVSTVGALVVAVRGWRTANRLLAQRRSGDWPPRP
jgi:uncharacterized membrane protein